MTVPLRTTSKEARDAIRADVLGWVNDYMEYTDIPKGREASPFEVWQELKHQMAYEFAHNGPYEAMRQNMMALSFGDYIDAREHVQSWLQQSDEEASRYAHEQAEELYCRLVTRELLSLADKTTPDGFCTEFNPYISQGGLKESVTVLNGGERIANVTDLTCAQASWLKRYIDRSIHEGGTLPPDALLLASQSPSCLQAENPLEAALRQIVAAGEHMRARMLDIDAWMRGEVDDEAYYRRAKQRDEAMLGDSNMGTLACDMVEKGADKYFRHCTAAAPPNEHAIRKAEPARAAMQNAMARAAGINGELKPQAQNRQAASIGR